MPWRKIPAEWSANDGDAVDELRVGAGGVKSLHVKAWEGADGGNVGNERVHFAEDWFRLTSMSGNMLGVAGSIAVAVFTRGTANACSGLQIKGEEMRLGSKTM